MFRIQVDSRVGFVVVFFFKQKTAYEMRISDWSSDVCSSDLGARKNLRLLKWLKQTQSASVGRSKTIFDEGEIVMASTGDQAGVKPARNWWKIGFFVMLIMFEAAREWAVAMTYEPPKISSGF